MTTQHPIQRQIINQLTLHPSRRYSELTLDNTPNNKLTFHVQQLQEANLVIKDSAGNYTLTTAGKQMGNRMDNVVAQVEKQAKVGVLLVILREYEGRTQTLIETRLKHPFYGCQGFMTGKIAFGESVLETAERELWEETCLEGKPELIEIQQVRDYDSTSKVLLQDKFFFVCRVWNPTGVLRAEYPEGRFDWVDIETVMDFITQPYHHTQRDTTPAFLSRSISHTADGLIQYADALRYVDTF